MEGPPADKCNGEYKQVDEELLLKQITELVITERLASGKALENDRVINFVHPEELKVTLMEIHIHLLFVTLLQFYFVCIYINDYERTYFSKSRVLLQ